MKTIILATDYTKASNHALVYAATLAKHIQAKIVLYNAFELPEEDQGGFGRVSPHINKLFDENKIRLYELANKTAKEYQVEVSWVTNLSFAEEEIGKLVKEYDAQLVVMGMKKEAAEFPLFGSTTTAVISQGKYPVLVVPETAQIQEPSRLLFACDYHCISANNNLPVLKEIAQVFKAKVEILHVKNPKEDVLTPVAADSRIEAKLENLLTGIAHEYRDVTEEDVFFGIERSMKEYQADMLVMVPHRLGFWNWLFQNSTTRKMAFKTQIPLLCLPNLPTS